MSPGPVRQEQEAGPQPRSGARFSVLIQVDGRTLKLKEFLQDMIGGASLGLVLGLQGVDDPSELVIRVRKV